MDLRSLINFKDVLWCLLRIFWESLELDRLVQILEQVSDLFILFLNGEQLIALVLLKLFKLTVKVSLQLENDLLKELDLGTFARVFVEFVGLVYEFEGTVTFKGSFDVIDASLRLHDTPVDLFHAFDVTLLALFGKCSQASFFIGIALACLCAQFALRDRENRLTGTVSVHLDRLVIIFVRFLLKLACTGLFKDSSSLSDRIIVEELGLARDTIKDVVLKTAIVSVFDDFVEFLLHTLQLLAQLDLSLHSEVLVKAFFLLRALSDRVVVYQFVAVDGLACFKLAFLCLILSWRCHSVLHVVPSALNTTLSEKLHCQARHLALLSDVGA